MSKQPIINQEDDATYNRGSKSTLNIRSPQPVGETVQKSSKQTASSLIKTSPTVVDAASNPTPAPSLPQEGAYAGSSTVIETTGTTVIIDTTKDVYVNTTEQITEQKYITNNVSGGYSGFSGFSGPAGASGSQGPAGSAGASGYSGFSGAAGSASPGGADTQLQYNNAGSLGGISTATYDGSKLSLGCNTQVGITGGSIGQVLCTDGSGNLGWTTPSANVSLDSKCQLAIGGGLTGTTTGYGNNIAIGYCSQFGAQYTKDNVSIGTLSMACNSLAYGNVGLGSYSLYSNIGGKCNVAIGRCSMYSNTYGDCNVAIGANTLYNLIGPNGQGPNIAIGEYALFNHKGQNTIAIGIGALCAQVNGSCNLAIGNAALLNSNCGFYNLAIGACTLCSLVTGNSNSAIGVKSLQTLNTGSRNVAQGYASLTSLAYGCNNTAIGVSSLNSTYSGCNNTAVGTCAGTGNQGTNNTFIGFAAVGATATSNNTITLGNSSVDCIRAQVTTISGLSDNRDKTDVEDIPLGLEFVLNLRPVKFTWNMRDGGKVGIQDSGFIAQDVAALEDQYEVAGWLDMVGRENPEKLELKPGKLIPILVKAIQELNSKVTNLETEIAALKGSNG